MIKQEGKHKVSIHTTIPEITLCNKHTYHIQKNYKQT